MKIKETTLTYGGKILIITLSPAEAKLIAGDTDIQPKVGYWFEAIENDTEYNVRIDVERSHDGTAQPDGD